MWRRFKHRAHLKSIMLLLAYPLLLTSFGYALFSQDLSIDATATKPAYTATPGMSMSYTYTTTFSGGLYTYNVTATVKNIGAGSVTAWQVKFNLPSGFSAFSCASSVTCTTSGTAVTVNSGSGNSTIAAGASRNFTFTFKSSVQNYHLQNLYVIGHEPSFVAVSGLTVSSSAGTQSGDGFLRYKRPYTFTVTNNSGQPVKMWRIRTTGSWPSGNTVKSIDPGVHYMDLSTQLVMIRTVTLANSSSYVFVATLGYGLGWSLPGLEITGVQ